MQIERRGSVACGECDRLRRENRELREELEEWRSSDGEVVDTRIQDIGRKLNVRPQAVKMALILMRSPGEAMTHDRLARAIGYEGDNTRRITGVLAHHLRGAGIPVKSAWGIGQRISAEDAEKVRALL